MTKLDVIIDRVNHNYAQGCILSDELTEDQLAKLNISENDYADVIEVEIDFKSEEIDDILEVRVLKAFAYNGSNYLDITNQVDTSRLEKTLREEGYGKYVEDDFEYDQDYTLEEK